MNRRVHNSPNLIYAVGTQVVTLKQVKATSGRPVHPAGAVGVVVRSPGDRNYPYRIRFVDGFEAGIHHDQLVLLAEYKQGVIHDHSRVLATHGLFDRALEETKLPERPDYERANDFLIKARQLAVKAELP